MEPQADIALIGLAVMGQNLILNMNDHGFTVVAYNRTVAKVDEFLNKEAKGTKVLGAHSIAEMVSLLKKPRRVMLMVKAGSAVDDFIEQVLPHLEQGDIIIDGGNSLFDDTRRRTAYVESKGLLYVGTGVSGGEEGARHGPSIMPGGSQAAWPHVKPIFQSIAAKVDGGVPCCDWVGENGAGHYVKMVHNGIEYGDMQLICEAYQLMKDGLGMSADEMHHVFADWYKGDLDQVRFEFALIPFRKDMMHVVRNHAQAVFHQLIRFANELHVAVFDSVVDHLHVMAGAVFAHPITARRAVLDFGGNGLKDRFDMRPGRRRTARHDGWPVPRTFFATRNACADVKQPFGLHISRAATGVVEQRIPAIDDDVARLKMRQHLFDEIVHRAASLDHEHDAPRFFQLSNHFGN